MRPHVLDANALYRYITKSDGSEIVDAVFKRALVEDATVYMSVVNWSEVYYTLARRVGRNKAQTLLTEMRTSVNISLLSVGVEEAIQAADLKARYSLPYADCFAAALTGSQNVLVTADSDFERVPKLRLLKLPPAGKRQ